MNYVIYGAQGYALGAYEALSTLYSDRKIMCFLVSSMGNNASALANLPVKEIDAFSEGMSEKSKDDYFVYIATPENVQDEIEVILRNHGFRNYERLNSERWAKIAELYHIKMGKFIPISLLYHKTDLHFENIKENYISDSKLEDGLSNEKKTIPSIRIFMAKSHKDKPLKTTVTLPNYITPIQVGAANCDERITSVLDNTGENISKKNCNYCELTGLYWIWKNKLCTDELSDIESQQYYGLAQYRRMLMLSNDDLFRIIENDIDVVLPYPLPYEPSINAHHERYIKEIDWKALMSALKELQPEYEYAFNEILNQRYMYNYNVILAKKSVLRKYCEWIFPILERTEELSVPRGSERADRYIGYIGETLETLYFMKNCDNLKIVHAGCKLLV